MATLYCYVCGHKWVARIDNPLECPNCKNRHWQLSSRQQMQARTEVGKALKDGRLTKQPCKECGTTKWVEAHHPDYSKPLEIVWLCRHHHRLIHSDRVYTHKPDTLERPEPRYEPWED